MAENKTIRPLDEILKDDTMANLEKAKEILDCYGPDKAVHFLCIRAGVSPYDAKQIVYDLI